MAFLSFGCVLACGDASLGSPTTPLNDDGRSSVQEGNGSVTTAPSPSAVQSAPNEQLPPLNAAELSVWLREGHYLAWRCEESISPPRSGGVHEHTRVCWNNALVGADSTPYPMNAALVKEIYSSEGEPLGHAVNVKVTAGEGDQTWYFYERLIDDGLTADGLGEPECAGCHSLSPNDYVFVRPL